jgi:hypothetical protein
MSRIRVAASVTREGEFLHGGSDDAEELAISRSLVDATALPIFEAVKPIPEMSGSARTLFA